MDNVELAVSKIRQWREDPIQFVRDSFNADPDEWQKDALIAYTKSRRVAMKASKGVGKSCVMAWMILHFLSTNTHPKIAVTSISGQNLKDGLWSEISFWLNKSDFLKECFEVTKTRIYEKSNPETWFCSARTWAKGADSSQQANSLAGLHAENIMFVIDEAGGIPDAVVAAAEAALSGGGNCRLIISGNPTHLEGPLYRACTKERHLWALITINSDPQNPKRSPRVSIEWAKEQIEKYGADSPYVIVNVFGEFPPSSLNSLFSPELVEKAMTLYISETQYNFMQKRLGVDVALYGDDDSVIYPRQGKAAFMPAILKTQEPSTIAARVMEAKLRWNSELELVDCTGGWGSGVVDNLRMAGHSPMRVEFSGKSTKPEYFNKRAQMYWEMAIWLKEGGVLPPDPELVGELTATTYTLKNGKFIIEPKDLIKAKIGHSPDRADALACTFYIPDQPARSPFSHLMRSDQIEHDYNPIENV